MTPPKASPARASMQPASPAEIPVRGSAAQGKGQTARLERVLESRFGRSALIAVGVLALTLTAGLLHADGIMQDGRDPDWTHIFSRKAVGWCLWGLAAPQILLVARLLSRHVKWTLALLLMHSLLGYGTSRGLLELERHVSSEWLALRTFEQGAGRRAPIPDEGRMPGPGALRAEGPRERMLGPVGPGNLDRQDGLGLRPQRPRDHSTPEARRRLMRLRAGPRTEFGVMIYFVILGLGWSARSFLAERQGERRSAQLELQKALLEGELAAAKVQSLEGQLQPHFLFNALHSVGGLIRNDRSPEALQTLSALGGLLRATLEHGTEPEVSFERELALVQHYLDIEAIRLGDRLKVTTKVDAGLDSIPVPPLLLLPLVENAVKYAIAPRLDGGCIEIRANREGNHLHLRVSDDGPGFEGNPLAESKSRGAESTSIGLQNTHARLKTLYGEGATIDLQTSPEGGALVHICLPIQETHP